MAPPFSVEETDSGEKHFNNITFAIIGSLEEMGTKGLRTAPNFLTRSFWLIGEREGKNQFVEFGPALISSSGNGIATHISLFL